MEKTGLINDITDGVRKIAQGRRKLMTHGEAEAGLDAFLEGHAFVSQAFKNARGSGTSVAEVARLIKKFEKMRGMMKKMAKMGKHPAAAQQMMSRMQGRRG